jgi:hypothetical protein
MIKCYILDTDKDEKLGKYFHVREFACKDGTQAIFIDECLWTTLNILREKIGKPVIITSVPQREVFGTLANHASVSHLFFLKKSACGCIVFALEKESVPLCDTVVNCIKVFRHFLFLLKVWYHHALLWVLD